eukprot:CAMPEP_0116571412 /NCGR_PEP_ID=MMETSP0397-20121206/17546_1 /TAXON_ID=216820 /ORGANISM="Cyclophora tenuis, Strain ECT3854" /LENGTH=74 /DNA_ID=CAMNT_0004099507 /DNA_START=433 /DNA_END=657 /DNA_ORIENTATION=+
MELDEFVNGGEGDTATDGQINEPKVVFQRFEECMDAFVADGVVSEKEAFQSLVPMKGLGDEEGTIGADAIEGES